MKRRWVRMGVALALMETCVACAENEPAPANAGGVGPVSDVGSAGKLLGVGGSGSNSAGAPAEQIAGGAPSVPGNGGAPAGPSNAGSPAGGALPAAAGAVGTAGASTVGTGGEQKSAGCGVMDHPLSGTATIDVAGTSREYILKLPDAYSANTAYKLVFGWHWRGGKASDVASGTIGGGPYYGLDKAAKGSTIFVAPNGIDNGWANTSGRDIAFLKAMLALFESKLCIDQSRIFSTGFSYGGMMCDTIGCEMADVFRAIAPMSGALYSGCTKSNTQPIAMWMSHGSSDDVVPLADGKAALDVFLKKNGCGAETSATTPSPCVAYQGCSAGHPVTYCEFAGGHQPPNFASAAIWDFFNQF